MERRCLVCGSSEQIHMHHIILEFGEKDFQKSGGNIPEDRIPLCSKHHKYMPPMIQMEGNAYRNCDRRIRHWIVRRLTHKLKTKGYIFLLRTGRFKNGSRYWYTPNVLGMDILHNFRTCVEKNQVELTLLRSPHVKKRQHEKSTPKPLWLTSLSVKRLSSLELTEPKNENY